MKIVAKQTFKVLSWLICALVLMGGVRFLYLSSQGNFHAITPKEAYRSAQMDNTELEYYITKYKISTVINLRGEQKNEPWYFDEVEVCRKYNVFHYNLRMSAEQMPSNGTIKELLSLFIKAPRPVLIHCKAGADRSGLAAALWKTVINGIPKDQAKNQLTIWYGHMPFGPTQVLDEFFENYSTDKLSLNYKQIQIQ